MDELKHLKQLNLQSIHLLLSLKCSNYLLLLLNINKRASTGSTPSSKADLMVLTAPSTFFFVHPFHID